MAIDFMQVTKRYRDGTVAVQDLTLHLPSKAITVLAGSSGSGKTTMLRMINRMVEPSSGQILWDSEPVSSINAVQLRRRIGYVMQDSGLLPHRKIIDNIATVPRLLGQSKTEARARARELMELVGLAPQLADRYPSQLSGGQAQRVGVARGLAADPLLLLMDEPFAAVDPIVRQELQEELVALQRRLGKTVVFVTHDINEALAIADKLVILQAPGVIAQAGSPKEVVNRPASAFVRDFVTGSAARDLHLAQVDDGQTLVVDADGRPVGVLSGALPVRDDEDRR